ncbi:SDR family NAD(P)-dependent oxidoreductase [Streptomyces sp. NPDC051840]|uniref:SDR family NAD(P)-dependent oxidoreductase n=1 Tax=Streptomyces sp. NPDC051840 TaxID=3154752 RepID=UPI003417A399
MTAAGNAVITGAGSGLGRTIALELARRGYAVFGTARSQDEVDEVAAATDGHVQLLVCDITDETQVASFAAQVTMRTQGVVHLLVSNAGTLTPGPLESVSLDAARREFSVNTFGVLTVVNAFLPALRAARGRIVQVSTVSVDFPSPFNGLSAASKAAAETLMTVYRTELALSGVDVVVAVPGNMRTGGPARTAAAVERARAALSPAQAEVYGAAYDRFADRINSGQAGGLDADEAARQVADLAERDPAPAREPVGQDAADLLAFVRQASPDQLEARRRVALAD